MEPDYHVWPLEKVVPEFRRVFPTVELGWINGGGMRDALSRAKFVAKGPRVGEYKLVTALQAKSLEKGWKLIHRDPGEATTLHAGGIDFLFDDGEG